MALKLDIKKACDIFDWGFVKATFTRMGFLDKFVDYIMTCIITVTYVVNINGKSQGHIKPTRGIRQGDPLSPYIFIICDEILSTNLVMHEMKGELKGLRISKKSPPILHLMYADDLLITSMAKSDTCIVLQQILHSYSTSAGQAIKREKSSPVHHPKLWPT